MDAAPEVWTLGHSTHPFEQFADLLHGAGIEVVADVRSVPWSAHAPQYRQPVLRSAVSRAGLRYVYLGDLLGARPDLARLHTAGAVAPGRPDDDAVVASDEFRRGIDRVVAGAQRYRVALVCAEEDPTGCHRSRLVTPALLRRGVSVTHLRGDGTAEPAQHLPTLFD